MKFTLLLFLSVFFFSTICYGQTEVSKQQFGILFSGVLVEQIGHLPINSSNIPYQEEIGSGFSLGILYQYQINRLIAIRPQAMISFRETAHYNDAIQREDLSTSFVHTAFPVHALFGIYKWKFIPYLAVGGRYEMEIAEVRKNNNNESLLDVTKNNTFAIDAGVGMTFPTKHFLFRPEILASWGANNILDLSNVNADVRRNSLEIRLIFQGS
jgi:hypothetical protein